MHKFLRFFLAATLIAQTYVLNAADNLQDPDELPLLEDVKPHGLKKGQIWMALADTQSVVFQGDTLTVPIKIATALKDRVTFELAVRPILRSEQTRNNIALGGHWINGYTPDRKMTPSTKDDMFGRPTVGEISSALPLTKYFRLLILESAKPGIYILNFRLKTSHGELEQNFKLAIHEGMIFSNPEVTQSKKGLTIKVRDRFGVPMNADKVSLSNNEITIIAQKDLNEVGSYLISSNLFSQYKSMQYILVEKQGFKPLTINLP